MNCRRVAKECNKREYGLLPVLTVTFYVGTHSCGERARGFWVGVRVDGIAGIAAAGNVMEHFVVECCIACCVVVFEERFSGPGGSHWAWHYSHGGVHGTVAKRLREAAWKWSDALVATLKVIIIGGKVVVGYSLLDHPHASDTLYKRVFLVRWFGYSNASTDRLSGERIVCWPLIRLGSAADRLSVSLSHFLLNWRTFAFLLWWLNWLPWVRWHMGEKAEKTLSRRLMDCRYQSASGANVMRMYPATCPLCFDITLVN